MDGMNDVLFTYRADSADALYLWIGIVVAVSSFVGTYLLLRNPGQGRKHTLSVLMAMLLFFAGLMAAATSFFSGWSLRKQGVVEIFADRLVIGKHEVPFDQIKELYLKKDQSGSVLQQEGKQYLFLVIQDRSGKASTISDQNYPVYEIMEQLKATIAAANTPSDQ